MAKQGYTGHTASSGKAKSGTATARTNPGVSPSRANGTPAVGNSAPLAKMPANNNGTFPVKMGSGMKGSQLAQKQTINGGNSGSGSGSSTGKPNMPATNKTSAGPSMGTTMHKVGQVPGYLKRKVN